MGKVSLDVKVGLQALEAQGLVGRCTAMQGLIQAMTREVMGKSLEHRL